MSDSPGIVPNGECMRSGGLRSSLLSNRDGVDASHKP